MAVAQEKMQTLADFWPLAAFLVEPQETDPKAWDKVMKDGSGEALAAARDGAGRTPSRSTSRPPRPRCARVVDRLGVKPKQVFQPVRVAISGSTISPGIFESVVALGRDETLARVDAALERLQRARLTPAAQ